MTRHETVFEGNLVENPLDQVLEAERLERAEIAAAAKRSAAAKKGWETRRAAEAAFAEEQKRLQEERTARRARFNSSYDPCDCSPSNRFGRY